MSLRLTLLCIGLVILIGVFLYSRGMFSSILSRLGKSSVTPDERKEPVLDSESDSASNDIEALATDKPKQQQFGRLHQSGQVAEAPAASTPAKRVIAIRLVPEHDDHFSAERLILALRDTGLVHGDLGVFHRCNDAGVDIGTFSVANLVEPGSFDLSNLKNSNYPGVSLFMILPLPLDGVAVFDDMLMVARQLVGKMDGLLLDESGNRLSVQRERYLREEVIEFERLRLAASAG